MNNLLSAACRLLPAFLLVGTAAPGAESTEPRPAFEEILKIDVHSHIFDDVPEVVEMMDRNRIRIVNICVRGNNPVLMRTAQEMAERLQARYGRHRFPFASTFDLTRREAPDYVDQVKSWLDASFEAGAVMVKIWKEVGMEIKDRDGRFILPDDPLFDPIYAFLADRGQPLLAHLAEPLAAWLPLDPENVHYGYYSNNPEWHLYGRDEFPSHAELIASRDRILERHPNLVLIGAHLGSLEHDVDEVARRLDRYFGLTRNLETECNPRPPRPTDTSGEAPAFAGSPPGRSPSVRQSPQPPGSHSASAGSSCCPPDGRRLRPEKRTPPGGG
jgi:predicted TIM-barrel fold metal-dependent hydrolase